MLLPNIDGYVDPKSEFNEDILHNNDAMDFYLETIKTGNIVEISKAESAENNKFKVVATASNIVDYKAYDIKETKTGELYAVPYEMKGSNASDYSMQ